MAPDVDTRLCEALRDHPLHYSNVYSDEAHQSLIESLFHALTNYNPQYLDLLFRGKRPQGSVTWKLRDAQGAVEGSEYTESARGKRCGHIFKSGEATYRCKTCTADDTCVLCSRCFDASDHTGHVVFINVSPGNSGCCDCGDPEAWRIPVLCAIHTATNAVGKGKEVSYLPDDLRESIKTTVGRAFDYVCDVISCSPEQLRLQKTEENIRYDEKMSRLTSEWYHGGDREEAEPEFALVLWNDEKHTVMEVRDQVRRACKKTMKFGQDRANEANDIGRSVVEHSKDLDKLLKISKIIEQIKVTVTIRSSRDTFREQMCGAIIEWLVDIAGCCVGDDNDILRHTICTEMLSPWRNGSEATNAEVGRSGIDDHEIDETKQLRQYALAQHARAQAVVANLAREDRDDDNSDADSGEIDEPENDRDDDEEEEGEITTNDIDVDEMEMDHDFSVNAESAGPSDADGDLEMQTPTEQSDDLEIAEATMAGYPPPPPPPPRPHRVASATAGSIAVGGSRQHGAPGSSVKANIDIPKTPFGRSKMYPRNPPSWWDKKPPRFHERSGIPPHEDLWTRLRLDWMILFDLRLWKKARIDLRDLYISTIVTVPEFKRVLGLRFAGLYTPLAQLYLIADREPDHSIINLSLQMLTTPSITEEVVDRGNFLTNLMAILYTFLTTRQVGHPHDVNGKATLAFDAGSVTNRRLYHFFMDLKYLLQSPYVQEKVRTEEQYILQFLDLVKLPQGICPNVRAVGDHVEYETDAWIGASLLTREINRLCRQFAEAFVRREGRDSSAVLHAIRLAAKATIFNSMGAERKRFEPAEIKHATLFKRLDPFDFEIDNWGHAEKHLVVDFTVEKGAISFHHALHYTLSWLLECGKSMPAKDLRDLLILSAEELRDQIPHSELFMLDTEAFLMAVFDFPLRVCAWLAQMKAGMWVRNGLSLRHQMSQYRGVSLRDVAHNRDIFLLQTAFVVCNPSRVLATMIERFGMDDWMKGTYRIKPGYEDTQLVDVAEDFIQLMIILLSDRACLIPLEDEPEPLTTAIRRDLAHILCFKPLSFSDLSGRLNDKFSEAENFSEILEEMTNYRGPEGLNDSGTFELKAEYIELIDPYGTHYSKNQRDEAENIYKNWMAKKTGKPASDIVYEPKLRPIKSGAFTGLAAFSKTPLFAQIIYFALGYTLQCQAVTPNIPATRVETFLQVVLHLALTATLEDDTDEDEMTDEPRQSFIHHALHKHAKFGLPQYPTIITILQKISTLEEFASCNTKIRLILKRFWQKTPRTFHSATAMMKFPFDRIETASPANGSENELELKKKAALERQARVMANFQQQQQKFLANQGGIDWGEEDFSDLESDIPAAPETQKMWKYPAGTCILCQEDTNDSRLYGTFALLTDSNILRQTDLKDPDFEREVLQTPKSLDRSADAIRPFGVSGDNHQVVRRLTTLGEEIVSERQILGKGFPSKMTKRGPVTTGCGHIMHYACFETYYAATQRRQNHQIARNHPERLVQKEFVCPLCKALGNAFLPIIWRGKEESYPGALAPEVSFNEWMGAQFGLALARFQKQAPAEERGEQDLFVAYTSKNLIPPLASKLDYLFQSRGANTTSSPTSQIARVPSILSAFRAAHAAIGPSSPTFGSDAQEASLMFELVVVYKRLRDTIRANMLTSSFEYSQSSSGLLEDLVHTDTLAKSVGYSISAVEIAQRGVGSDLEGGTLLDKIPNLQLTHLRILSETAFSYMSIGGLVHSNTRRAVDEFGRTARLQLCQLLTGHPATEEYPWAEASLNEKPLFSQDIFVFLSEFSLCAVPALTLDVHHVIRLCYMAEIIKVVVANFVEPDGIISLLTKPDSERRIPDETGDIPGSTIAACRGFTHWIAKELQMDYMAEPPAAWFDARDGKNNDSGLWMLTRLIRSYALPFLRKVTILLHVRFGVEFPNTGFADIEDPELDRLTRALRLPTLEQVFSLFSPPDHLDDLQQTAGGWISHWVRYRLANQPQGKDKDEQRYLSLSHPAIFELVGLPKHFDVLTEETMRRKCPTTGKELTDPSICLFCGEIFCSQAVCCMKGGKLGGCNQHLEK
jgi:E3 ubiquitin-protein ligase UBR1